MKFRQARAVFLLSVMALFGWGTTAEPVNAAPAPAGSVDQQILQTAKGSLGKEMWHGYGLSSGKLGCAAAVSNVLKNAGVLGVNSAAVVIIRRQILNHPKYSAQEICVKKAGPSGLDAQTFQTLSRPGDVLLAFMEPPTKPNLGPNAHCGFVGTDGNVYTNDWNDGIWKYAPIEQYFSYYPYIYVIRLKPKSSK